MSLEPLIAFWTRTVAAEGPAKAALARIVADLVRGAPELAGTIEDAAVIERHRESGRRPDGSGVPARFLGAGIRRGHVPLPAAGFLRHPAHAELVDGRGGRIRARVNLDTPMVAAMRMGYAYALVLRRLYGIEVDVDYPLICAVTDPDTGLERHFRVFFDWRFEEVVARNGVPPLSDEVRQHLHANLLDPVWLREALPPEQFLIRGFTIFRAMEVTDQEVLSALKRDLIDRESIVSNERFLGLQNRLRTLFRRPKLLLGLAAIDGDRVLLLNYGARHENACIFADSSHYRTKDFAGSCSSARCRRAGRSSSATSPSSPSARRPRTTRSGAAIRNKLVAPLHYQDRVIGTLSLGSPNPGTWTPTTLPKLHEVLPLFSMAVQRSMDELNARVQTQIKEKFTAIHPVVEWRFRKAVLDGLETHHGPAALELQPIVFANVYPLYALSDIRGSSIQRALAIQSDLLTQLGLARDVIQAAHRARQLPALDELLYRIEKSIAEVESELAAGAEVGVIARLRSDVETMFEHLQSFGADVQLASKRTEQRSIPSAEWSISAVRCSRKASPASPRRSPLASTSRTRRPRRCIPHYFEKQKTDGVDHQIYVGASLVEDGRFDPLYLKNLRLWQLMVVCGVAARADQLVAELPVPLQTTHLILVQHTPMSIRFRFDEKRFDVDGAYDIRYEIVKKRIDKALVRGSSERVTQPGKIAIVYSQPDEAAEYRTYIEYLQHLGYLGSEVEDLELGELQGVHGLRALRVTVTLPRSPAGAADRAARIRAGAIRSSDPTRTHRSCEPLVDQALGLDVPGLIHHPQPSYLAAHSFGTCAAHGPPRSPNRRRTVCPASSTAGLSPSLMAWLVMSTVSMHPL